MSVAQPPAEIAQESYNEIAIRTATTLDAARRSARARAQATKADAPIEAVFPKHYRPGYGIAREYAAMGNQPVSDALLARADSLGYTLEHLGTTLGTVIHNIDLKSCSAEQSAFVRAVLLERKVVFFRDQHLTEEQQVAFGHEFGELDAFPFGKPGKNPFILEIIHNKASPGMENGFHTDVTWMEQPSLGSVAQLIKKPPYGGDTLFSDSHAAYHGLPEALKQRLEHLHGVHDYRVFLGGRGPTGLSEEQVAAVKRDIPFGVAHPLLRTHPETGKTALYLHNGFLRHDSLFDVRTGEPLPKEESEAIVQQLITQHASPEYVCRFAWTEGAIAFWDNRAVQHYAASDYYPHDRVLRRVTVSGDRPYYRPQD